MVIFVKMKRTIFIFILFVVGLAACAAERGNIASDNADANCLQQYEMKVSSVHDYDSSICCDDVFDNPVRSMLFTHCSHICSGYVRTINRCMRFMYRYNPVAFLRGRKVISFAVARHFQNNRNVFCSVKLSDSHGFIRFRKLLI